MDLTRRDLLKLGGLAACSAFVPACAHRIKTGETDISAMKKMDAWKPGVSTAYIPKEEPARAYDLFKRAVEASTDFSWLSKGDSVLVKLALNSSNPYPATTDPWSLHAMITLLREKGAGRILVGDSSGVESVHWQKDKQRGSSRKNCGKAGLLKVIEDNGAEAVFFEERGYDAFIPMTPEGPHHWKEPLYVTNAVNDADHIVYLPRVSSHVMGDITSGMKIGVGFLREDSRRIFHCGGDDFYAMYEEINRIPAILSRLRLTVSSGTKVLSTFGPDNGHVTCPGTGLVIASEDLFAHEIMAYAWLLHNREFETGFFDVGITGRFTKIRSSINKGFVWFIWKEGSYINTPPIPLFIPGNIFAHPSIMNAMKRNGGLPAGIAWEQVNPSEKTGDITRYLDERVMTGQFLEKA
jgi:uncharacterized protein (DUF362 family)